MSNSNFIFFTNSKGEVIGLYLGKYEKKKDTKSKLGGDIYQLGHINSEKGFGGNAFLGMHFANDPAYGLTEGTVQTYVKEPNAVFYNDYTVVAKKPIRSNEEILINYYYDKDYDEYKEINEKKRKAIKAEKAREKRKLQKSAN